MLQKSDFKAGQMGQGALFNGASVILRPCMSGFRIHAGFAPCVTLPFGGYVTSVDDGVAMIARYRATVVDCARSAAVGRG